MYGGRTWPWNTYRCGLWQCKPSFHGNWNETKPHAVGCQNGWPESNTCKNTMSSDKTPEHRQPKQQKTRYLFMCNRDLYAETETCHDGNSPAGCPQRKTSICPVSETRPSQCQLASFTNVDQCIWNAPPFPMITKTGYSTMFKSLCIVNHIV